MGILKNESIITTSCVEVHGHNENLKCDNLLTILNFWGASMVIFATIFYTIPYAILVAVYFLYSDLRTRAYDKSILSFNIYYILINICLITLGSFELCHKILPPYIYGIVGIILVYLVQQTCMWLFAICFDITLVITKFQWAPGNNDTKKRNENKKFRTYTLIIFIVSIVPTSIAIVGEFLPFLSKDSILRTNFSDFYGKHKFTGVVYTLTVPVLMLFMNTILFIYTTFKMLRVHKDTAFLNKNSVKKAKNRYWVYLKLYLIMDSPWLSGALSAIYPSLWMLKFVRMIQPLLVLYVTLPKNRLMKAVGCRKNRSDETQTIRMIKSKNKKLTKDPDDECGVTKSLANVIN